MRCAMLLAAVSVATASVPTQAPTSAPTGACPVTCERDDGQYEGKFVYGYGKQFGKPEFHETGKRNHWMRERIGAGFDAEPRGPKIDGLGRIVTTHDVLKVNTGEAYKKHRCYKIKDADCVCECLGTHDFPGQGNHQSGTIQGNANGINGNNLLYSNVPGMTHSIAETSDGHLGAMPDQSYYQQHKSIFRQDNKRSSTGGLMYRHGTAPWSVNGEKVTGRKNAPYGKVYYEDYGDGDV